MTEKKERIDFIDYLKAVCVILVVVTHYDWGNKDSLVFTMFINMAVPVFMIISGYTFAMSNAAHTDGHLSQMYSPKAFLRKLDRFVSPFLVICFAEIFLLLQEDKKIKPLRIFLLGAYGPGSYYVPLMIQLLIVFPIIYVLVKKCCWWGILVTGLANLAFEIAVVVLDVSRYYYRLCLGRYLLLIALGCFLYLHPEKRIKNWQMAVMLAMGLFYILGILGQDIRLPIFHFWKPTAMPIAFYIFPVTVIAFRLFYHKHIPGLPGEILSKIGKASYHIFLVQMVYFHFELGGFPAAMNWYVAIPYDLAITLGVGILFYELESKLRMHLHREKTKAE